MDRINIKDYNYSLPGDRIARYPLTERDQSKLLVYSGGHISQTVFKNLPDIIPDKQLLVFNNTRVIQARLLFRKESGARIEIFCLEPYDPLDYYQAFSKQGACTWKCLVGNARKWKSGMLQMSIKGIEDVDIKAIQTGFKDGAFLVSFSWEPSGMTFSRVMELAGNTPIPPYLDRDAEESDRLSYQTVYSKIEGSVAAPTSGLHFTEEVLDRISKNGNKLLETTLHIGAGTFQPVINRDIATHVMHKEHIYFTVGMLEQLIAGNENILAIGTTSVRTLESLYWMGVRCIMEPQFFTRGMILKQWDAYELPGNYSVEESYGCLIRHMRSAGFKSMEAITQLLIMTGYSFRLVSRMITNFHLPQSTLLLLVAAFTGGDWKNIYNYALENDFRFLSYGDSSYLERVYG